MRVWAMTGPGPNPLTELADEVFCVQVASTSAVQEVHLIAVHTLCATLDAELACALVDVGRSIGPEEQTVSRA